MLSGRSVVACVRAAEIMGAGVRGAPGVMLCCIALGGCLGEPGELFPATSIGSPSAEAAAEPAPALPSSDPDAMGETSSPPGALGAPPAERSSEGAPQASPPLTRVGERDATSPAEGPAAEASGAEEPPVEPSPVEGPLVETTAGSAPASEVGGGEPRPPRVCTEPAEPVLLDFDGAGSDVRQALFGDFQAALSGGTYVYPVSVEAADGEPPTSGLLSDVTAGDWHISGLVTEQSGFGLFFDCQLLDASRFVGVAFRISGDLGDAGPLTFLVGTADNDVSATWRLMVTGTSEPSFGRCTPATSEFDGTCTPARRELGVGPAAREVFVPFTALAGGRPDPGVNAAEITTIAWALPPPVLGPSGEVVPYAVDVRVDDIRFVESPPSTP